MLYKRELPNAIADTCFGQDQDHGLDEALDRSSTIRAIDRHRQALADLEGSVGVGLGSRRLRDRIDRLEQQLLGAEPDPDSGTKDIP